MTSYMDIISERGNFPSVCSIFFSNENVGEGVMENEVGNVCEVGLARCPVSTPWKSIGKVRSGMFGRGPKYPLCPCKTATYAYI